MELYSFIGIVEFLNYSKLPAVSSTEKIKKEKTFLRSKSNISLQDYITGKNRDRGSIFSHETALLAAGDHATARNVFSVLL